VHSFVSRVTALALLDTGVLNGIVYTTSTQLELPRYTIDGQGSAPLVSDEPVNQSTFN